MGHHRILPTPQRAHLPTSYQKSVLPSASPLPLPHAHAPDLRLPAILEGWPHHLQEANHHRGFPCPGLPAPWMGYTPCGAAPSTTSPLEKDRSPEKLEQTWPVRAISTSILRQSSRFSCPGEEHLGFSAAQLASPTLRGVLHSCGTAAQHHQHPARAPTAQKS